MLRTTSTFSCDIPLLREVHGFERLSLCSILMNFEDHAVTEASHMCLADLNGRAAFPTPTPKPDRRDCLVANNQEFLDLNLEGRGRCGSSSCARRASRHRAKQRCRGRHDRCRPPYVA